MRRGRLPGQRTGWRGLGGIAPALRGGTVAIGIVGLLLAALGCGKTAQEDGLVARGRSVYMTNCITCHHTDPARDGNVGPALKGSSLELLQFRVLRIQYPPGYKPKRPTKLMPALPHLQNDIPALHAFLNQ